MRLLSKLLTCLLLAFVFQPNAILAGEEDIATSFEGYVILSPVPIEYASTGTPASFQAWTIKVYDEKRVRLRRNRENEQESPQQITELYQRLHRSAGAAVKIFLEQNTLDELAAKLRHLMRNERITADRLNGYVHIHFLDDDDEKLSYIVEFNQKIEPDWHIFIVLNLPKQMDPAVLEARLADQNKLGVAFPELTPHVGDSIRTENFSAYFEEYATGEKLSSLMKKREFDEEKLKQTVQGLMQMYQALGYLSTDLRPKNILLVNQGKENQHVLFTDLQPLSVSRPHQILEKMNRYYGGQKLSGKGLFRKSKQENPRDIIFAEILSTLGAKDGRRFLQRALKKLNDDLSEMKDPALGKEPDDRLLNLTKDLNFFLNRPQALQ